MNAGRKDLLALLLISILAWIAYSNAFHGEFQYDDDRLIRFNFALRDLSAWQNIARTEAFRPLTLITYAVNYRIGQKDPFSYHVLDFVLHLLSTGLFFVFIRRISKNVLLCFFSAALFAVHPLNTESVSYTASRPILLCALFYWAALLSFDGHLRKPAWFKPAGFFLFLLLGLLCKEESALIPATALLHNYAFFGRESVKKHRIFHIVTFLLIACGAVFRLLFVDTRTPYSLPVYISTEIYVWLRYLGLAIFPIPLNVDHFVEPLYPIHWKFLLSLIVVAFLMFMLWRSRKSHPWIVFWGAWFCLNLAASSFVPLNDFMAEHRTYLSMFGFSACLAYTVTLAKSGNRLIPFAISCLLIFYTAATWKRNLVWQKRVTLWADAVEKSPQKYRPHINLAFVLFQLRQYDAALQEYLAARALNPYSPYVHSGLGFTLLELGRKDLAEKSFRTTLAIDPNFVDAKTGLGMIRYGNKQYEEALAYFVQVYPSRRESVDLIVMMCEAYLHLGRSADALQILSNASTWDPRFLHVRRLLESGKREETLNELQRMLPS